jgi:hypothetical protein
MIAKSLSSKGVDVRKSYFRFGQIDEANIPSQQGKSLDKQKAAPVPQSRSDPRLGIKDEVLSLL